MNWYLISFNSDRQDILVEEDSPDEAESLVRHIGTQSPIFKEVDEDFEVKETDIQSRYQSWSRIKSDEGPFEAYERTDDGVKRWDERLEGGVKRIDYTLIPLPYFS